MEPHAKIDDPDNDDDDSRLIFQHFPTPIVRMSVSNSSDSMDSIFSSSDSERRLRGRENVKAFEMPHNLQVRSRTNSLVGSLTDSPQINAEEMKRRETVDGSSVGDSTDQHIAKLDILVSQISWERPVSMDIPTEHSNPSNAHHIQRDEFFKDVQLDLDTRSNLSDSLDASSPPPATGKDVPSFFFHLRELNNEFKSSFPAPPGSESSLTRKVMESSLPKTGSLPHTTSLSSCDTTIQQFWINLNKTSADSTLVSGERKTSRNEIPQNPHHLSASPKLSALAHPTSQKSRSNSLTEAMFMLQKQSQLVLQIEDIINPKLDASKKQRQISNSDFLALGVTQIEDATDNGREEEPANENDMKSISAPIAPSNSHGSRRQGQDTRAPVSKTPERAAVHHKEPAQEPQSATKGVRSSGLFSGLIFSQIQADCSVFFTPNSYINNPCLKSSANGLFQVLSMEPGCPDGTLVPNVGYLRSLAELRHRRLSNRGLPRIVESALHDLETNPFDNLIALHNQQRLSGPKAAYRTPIPKHKVEKMVVKYKESLLKREAIIRKCYKQIVYLRNETHNELELLYRWSSKQLLSVCRKLAHYKLLRVEKVLEVEKYSQSILETRITLMNNYLLDATFDYTDKEHIDPALFLDTNSQIRNSVSLIHQIDSKVKDLERIWQMIRKNMPTPTFEYRQRSLRDIIENTPVHNADLGYHDLDPSLQDKFEKCIMDERFYEGKKIYQLLNFLETKRPGQVEPDEVVTFLEDFTSEIVKNFGISHPSDASIIRLYLDRSIYPRLIRFCRQFEGSDEAERDIQLAKNLRWIRSLPPQKLDVNMNFFSNEEDAYSIFHNAADILSEVGFQTVPTDMLYCVNRAAQLLVQGSKSGSSLKGGMSADDFVPLFIYVVSQADIPNVNRCIGFMERFSSPSQEKSQLGWGLTTFAAAVHHLLTLERSGE